MKKNNLLLWIVGLCAFLAFMLGGTLWVLGKCGVSGGPIATIKQICDLVLFIATFCAAMVWLLSLKIKNKTLRIVLITLLIVFFVLCILGVFGI